MLAIIWLKLSVWKSCDGDFHARGPDLLCSTSLVSIVMVRRLPGCQNFSPWWHQRRSAPAFHIFCGLLFLIVLCCAVFPCSGAALALWQQSLSPTSPWPSFILLECCAAWQPASRSALRSASLKRSSCCVGQSSPSFGFGWVHLQFFWWRGWRISFSLKIPTRGFSMYGVVWHVTRIIVSWVLLRLEASLLTMCLQATWSRQ